MTKLLGGLAAITAIAVGFAGFLIAGVLVTPLVAALAGAVFAFFFDETAASILSWLKLDIAFWQFMAFVGLVGGFFRASVSKAGE